MNKFTLIVVALVAFIMTSCKEDANSKIKKINLENAKKRNVVNSADAPVIKFDKLEHNWGDINEGDKVEAIFKYTNEGKSPLYVTKIKGSCGCTVPSNWSKEPLMPGQSAEFTVKFDSKNKPNKQQKTVTISCNTNKGNETVRIIANVKPDPEQEKKRAENKKKRAEAAAKRKAEAELKAN